MESGQQNRSPGERPKYVWDREKLAWVEAGETTTGEASAPGEGVPESGGTGEEARQDTSVGSADAEAVEAVLEQEAEYRGAWIRLAGVIIDYVVLIIIGFILMRFAGAPSWITLVLGFIYFVSFWLWRGQTPGKMIIRAKIVRTNGSSIGPLNAVARYLFYLVPSFAPILFFVARIPGAVPVIDVSIGSVLSLVGAIIGLILVGVNSEKRGLHDLVAGTCVINTRPPQMGDYRTQRGPDNGGKASRALDEA